ncbi:MAG: DUF3515 domain-containing protein [Actinomycetota bacterium]|nr:DUF3515 domain-containing protein [Actinomycetota bacterium]
MSRRPPLPRGTAGVLLSRAVAWAVAAAVATGCTGAVQVQAPTTSSQACTALLGSLPDTVAGAQRRTLEPADAAAAAWGDPPIVLRCGVGRPPVLNRTSRCDLVDEVGWFTEELRAAFRFTTIGRELRVELTVPFDYEPAAEVLVELAAEVKASVPQVRPCV